jgi:hypothetical protein
MERVLRSMMRLGQFRWGLTCEEFTGLGEGDQR